MDTRTKILNASWKLLESGQGEGVLMTNIAAKAGVSRQALYLHFKTRADLLTATTLYIDQIKNVDDRLEKSRNAQTGEERLSSFIEAWGNYIPEIYGVAKALISILDTDEESAAAWNGRMQALREGCFAAITAINNDGKLPKTTTVEQATDMLWTILSIQNWELLTKQCGWSQSDYVKHMKSTAKKLFIN